MIKLLGTMSRVTYVYCPGPHGKWVKLNSNERSKVVRRGFGEKLR